MTCVPNNFFLWYTLYLTKVRRLPLFGTTATTLWYDSYHSVVFLLSSGGIGKIARRYCIKETGWKSFGGRGGKGNNCLCFLIIKRLTLEVQKLVAVSPRHCYETTHLIIRDDDFLTTAGIGDIL